MCHVVLSWLLLNVQRVCIGAKTELICLLISFFLKRFVFPSLLSLVSQEGRALSLIFPSLCVSLSLVFHLVFQLLHCCFGSYSWYRLLQRCGTLHWGKLNLSHSSQKTSNCFIKVWFSWVVIRKLHERQKHFFCHHLPSLFSVHSLEILSGLNDLKIFGRWISFIYISGCFLNFLLVDNIDFCPWAQINNWVTISN